MSTTETLVIVPALNESASVAGVVRDVMSAGFDVVVVDDGSVDSTATEATSVGARVLRLPINLGVGAALRCGFRFAVEQGYSSVIQCDADGQHLPEFLPVLLNAGEFHDAHLVIGTRFGGQLRSPSPGFARRIAMRYLAFVTSRAARTTLTDVTSGFRLVRGDLLRNFAREFPPYYLGDTFEATYVAGRAGFRIIEVPVEMRERSHGRSSAPTVTAVRMVLKVLLTTSLKVHFPLPRAVDGVQRSMLDGGSPAG